MTRKWPTEQYHHFRSHPCLPISHAPSSQGGLLPESIPSSYRKPLGYTYFWGRIIQTFPLYISLWFIIHEELTLFIPGGGKFAPQFLFLRLTQNFSPQHMMKLYVNSYFILMNTLMIYFGQKYCL